MVKYWNIFLAFFRCGIFGFGGGQATVPLIEQEVVNTFEWLTIGEFSDAYAFGNSLPGPITTKLSALVGYKVGGVLGSIIAILGMILPSAIAVIILFSLYLKHKDAKWLKGMMKGVRPIVVVMISQVLYKIAKQAFLVKTNIGVDNIVNKQIDIKHLVITSLIGLVGGILLFKLKVHPIILIICSLILGGVFLS